jgi:O-acetyl-ADP-ribose deacetylase (regulator of RNase III)
MPITFIKQDLLKVVEDRPNDNGHVILHIGNCRGKMNLGLAKQIRSKWPQVYNDYKETEKEKGLILTDIIPTDITDTLTIYTLLAQENYGHKGIYINYNALRYCLNKVAEIEILINETEDTPLRNIYIPYGLGAGYAGGDWDTVLNIIPKSLHHFNVFVCNINN